MESGNVSANSVKQKSAEVSIDAAVSEVLINAHDHCRVYNKEKNKKIKVQCNYCGKIVGGLSRLKYHLARIRGDVTPCEKDPEYVKEAFRNELLYKKKRLNAKDVGELSYLSSASMRDLSYTPDRVERREYKSSSGTGDGVEMENSSKINQSIEMESPSEGNVNQSVWRVNRRIGPQLSGDAREKKDPLPRETQKLIRNFFYETGFDFSMSNAPSFKRMINGIFGHGLLRYEMPGCEDLKGWIFRDKMQEMQEYVKKIKDSWSTTGCSILLDGWVDDKGRNLIYFLVDCPEGPVYLRSADISSVVNDVNVEALFSLLDGIIEEEVGFNNVIQLIVSSTEGWMGAVGNRYQDRHPTFFWTVDASHCIGLILEKIGMMDSTREILGNAKNMTRLVHEHPSVLKVFQNHSPGHDLKETIKIESAVPFITLHNLESAKQQLKDMFSSSEWNSSTWVSSLEGRRVADLALKDSAFWTGVERVSKATIPLMHVLCSISNADKPQVGFIYETMYQAKEAIKREFKNKKSDYMPFWELIDEIRNAHLHSPLHAAGYYLNPSLFYSSSFRSDDEVLFGLSWSIIHTIPDTRSKSLIPHQMNKYSHAVGAFKVGTTMSQISAVAPALWWSLFGKDCPELQKCAIRVLSQTCVGATRYRLRRSMAEKLLTKGRNSIEQQFLSDLTFVHYNMQLAEHRSGLRSAIIGDEGDPMYDWVVGESLEFVSPKSGLGMDPSCREPPDPSWRESPVGNGASSSTVKEPR